MRILTTLVWSAVLLAASVAACGGETTPQPCNDIPAGGCPLSHGVACDDSACEARYACRENNVWELVERCPPRDAGGPTDAFVPPPYEASTDASFDAPPGAYGGPGCPSLVAPDCSLGVALACGMSCCGCEELFVCENAGWELWGVCGDAGAEPLPP